MDYKPSGVCSRLIHVELDGDKIANVEFVGGCAGNTAGISSLVKGMDAHEVIKRLEGTKCGARPTSCPDQLSKALKQALDAISERLLRELPGLRGFSSGNLKKMLRTIIT